jgi:hypothetical protein
VRVWVTTQSLSDVARFEPKLVISTASPDSLIAALRSTDHAGFVVYDRRRKTMKVECRPRCADRFYLRSRSSEVQVTAGLRDLLPQIRHFHLSSRFVSVWLANAAGLGPLDLFMGVSPFKDVQLVSRGMRADIDIQQGASAISFVNDVEDNCAGTDRLQGAIDQCRAAISDAVKNAARETDVVAECSGGIDSGVVAILASRAPGCRFRGAVFTDYPQQEFRKEKQFAESISRYGGFALHNSDHRLASPWGAWRLDRMSEIWEEPSLQAPSWGQVLAAAAHLSYSRSATIFSGHGGDLLFATHVLPPPNATAPTWLSKTRWNLVRDEGRQLRKWLESPNNLWCGYRLDNPWLSRALASSHPQGRYYSPLTARTVIKAFQNLRRLVFADSDAPPPQLAAIQKPLAYVALSDLLPTEVWKRRWKVDYAGLWYRFWLTFGHEVLAIARCCGSILREVDLEPRPVLRAIECATAGQDCNDGMLNALAAFLLWAHRARGS